MSIQAPSLEVLCRDLTTEFERDARGPRVATLLADYAAAHDCWTRYLHYLPGHYTRHLIHKNSHYELLLLSWDADQQSPIHNHMDQDCWMAVVEGTIEEVQFLRPTPGPLLQGRTTALSRGAVAYIHDDIALHLVRPGGGVRGASLHLYAKPYARCQVYDPETGAESTKELVYDAVHGQILPEPLPATEG